MKQFDLDAALVGDAVQTRSGKPVTQLKLFTGLTGVEACLYGVMDDGIYGWQANGRCYSGMLDSELDLFMAPTKKQGWVARYTDDMYPSGLLNGTIFNTEKECRESCILADSYHMIEWEE